MNNFTNFDGTPARVNWNGAVVEVKKKQKNGRFQWFRTFDEKTCSFAQQFASGKGN